MTWTITTLSCLHKWTDGLDVLLQFITGDILKMTNFSVLSLTLCTKEKKKISSIMQLENNKKDKSSTINENI